MRILQLCVVVLGIVLVLLGGMMMGRILILPGYMTMGRIFILPGDIVTGAMLVLLGGIAIGAMLLLLGVVTMGRVVVVLYTAAVVAIAWGLLPWHGESSYVQAVRYLGANTRLTPDLWHEPDRLEVQRIELARLEEALAGAYLRKSVEADARLTRADVMPWPELGDQEIVAVPLEDTPDFRLLNHGATVDVWFGQHLATAQHSVVQAIVPVGTKWIALMPRKDFSADSLSSSEKTTVRVVTLPHKPPPN